MSKDDSEEFKDKLLTSIQELQKEVKELKEERRLEKEAREKVVEKEWYEA